jgi:RNA polymerase sigma-70 factor (ECF subfamily)
MTESLSLLQRIASGDRAAASECIDAYSGLVWSLARRRLVNEADAEEAVQDIFMQLWRQAGRFDPSRGEEVTFVSVLARRRLVDRLRRQGRRPATTPLDEAELQLGEDGCEVLERSADVRRVRAILDTLEPKQREIIHLSSWLGLSHGAIAERTGLPLGTVKSHLRRGLMKVREQLVEARAAADGATP